MPFPVARDELYEQRNVMDIMEELARAEAHVGQNVNAKMVFFDLSLRLAVLIRRA